MTVNRNETLIPRKSYFNVSPSLVKQLLIQHGLDVETTQAVAAALTRLFDKFGADERLNYDVIEKFMQRPSGNGQRSVVATVAASNSSDLSKATADYVCTGTNDHLKIQEAIDYAMAFNRAGCVQLLEGIFSGNGDLTLTEDIWLRGSGIDATKLTGINIEFAAGNYVQVTDLLIRGTMHIADGVFISFLWLDRIEVDNGYLWSEQTGISGGVEWLFLTNSIFLSGGHDLGGGEIYSVDLANADDTFISNCWLDRGLRIYSPASFCYNGNLSNVHAEGRMFFGDFLEFSAVGLSNQADFTTFSNMGVNDFPWSVAESYFGPTTLVNCQLGNITGCILQTDVVNALVVDTTSHDNAISDTHITTSGSLAGAAGSKLVDIQGDHNHIHGLTARNPDTGTSDYFIEVSGDNNKIWGNDGDGCHTVGVVNDTGVSNDLTSANR